MKGIFIALFLWVVFIAAVLEIPYPGSITQANLVQIAGFFIPLFLAFTATINLFLKNILSAVSIASGIILLLILKALDSFDFVTGVLIIISVGLLFSYFRKSSRNNLTNYSKIPKLTKWR